MDREGGEEFGLAAGLDAEMPRRARVEDFLHDLAELVHLDREHAAVGRLVAGLGNRLGEGFVDRLHAVAQEVVEPHHEREGEVPRLRLGDDVHEVDRVAVALRVHAGMALGRDSEIAAAPAVDVVEGPGVPGFKWFVGVHQKTMAWSRPWQTAAASSAATQRSANCGPQESETATSPVCSL